MLLNCTALRKVTFLPVPKRLPLNAVDETLENAFESLDEHDELIEDLLEGLTCPQARAIRLTYGLCVYDRRERSLEEVSRCMFRTPAEIAILLADAMRALGSNPNVKLLQSVCAD